MGSPSIPADNPAIVAAVAVHTLDVALSQLPTEHRAALTVAVREWLAHHDTERTQE
jgi:hypothetical protein